MVGDDLPALQPGRKVDLSPPQAEEAGVFLKLLKLRASEGGTEPGGAWVRMVVARWSICVIPALSMASLIWSALPEPRTVAIKRELVAGDTIKVESACST